MAQQIPSRALQRFLARQPNSILSVVALLGAGALLSNQVQAQSPRVPTNALPVQAPDWLQRGTAATYSVNANQATVGLSGPATILHWRSLDVGADARLNFRMPSSTSRVLNKVDGGAWQNKTTIEGALNANGQVYIYNPNGILFGRGSTVNVNTLVASSLKLEDQRFMDGLISPSTAANMARDPALGAGFVPGAVVVEGGSADGLTQRAAITAQQYGMILLAAPQVSNSGLLSAPDGQVALAAGAKLYLVAPTDNAMRGLRVEVNSDGLAALSGAAPSATNTAIGVIDVKRGNITMVGLAVNQSGIASATTSVSLNGSIVLRAHDGASKSTPLENPQPKVGGTLTLGPGSSTLVLPDLQDIDAQTGRPRTALAPPAGPGFKPSTVTLGGQTIRLEKDAQVRAPGGQVSVDARANPDPNATVQAPTASRVELASGSVIDVAGASDVLLDMDSHVITAELRGGELADNVLLRDSAVRGKTVRFDARKARKNGIAVANLDAYLNQQTRTVGEFTADGGTVSIKSEGDLWLRAGSLVNVSGGSVQYQAGYVNTSKLSLGGRLYDLETAPANLPYDGVVNLANSTQNFELGYREGRSAGTVTLTAPRMALSGSLSGQLTLGEQQRDRGAAGAPLGGQLILGSAAADPLSLARDLQLRGGIDLSGKPATYYRTVAPITRGASDDGQGAMQLDVMALGLAGFNRFTLGTTGGIGLSEPMTLPLAGRLGLRARGDIRLAADLQMPGGALSASTPAQLIVGGGDKPIRLDVAGEWQNDLLRDAVAPVADALSHPKASFITRGGSVSLSANLLTLSQAALDVSGGAALDVAGKLSVGKAGSISLAASPFNLAGDERLTLGDGLTLAGYGLSSGGSLSLTAPNVTVGRSTGGPSDLLLDPLFFSQGGFTSRTVRANGNLSVQAGTDIHATAASWVLTDNAASLGGHSMGDVAATARLALAGPRGARPASSLSLSATGPRLPGDGQGRLTVGTDALVRVDSGGTISLLADNQLAVNGTLSAPAGEISLFLNAPVPETTKDNGYDATRSIWLGAQGRLLAQGSKARVYTDNAGLTVGDVNDGGSVRIGRQQDGQLSVAAATVVTEQGSLIDVSGTRLTDARLKSGGSVLAPQTLGSAGGSIDIRAREGLLLAGDLRGEAGSDMARGGSLSVMLDGEGRPGGPKYPKGPRQLFISTADPGSVLPSGLRPGDALPSQVAQGVLPLATFAQGGFSRLALSSEDQIGFIGDVALSVGSSLNLNAPVVAAGTPGQQVRLDAPYISLGNTVPRDRKAPVGSGGNAALTVRASNLDLTGQIATQGFGRVTLAASEDIRLNGVAKQDGPYTTGALSTGPALDLLATRIYPSTLSHFDIGLTGADSTLRFGSTGGAAAPVLSAAGSLSAHADRILQGGQVSAPFGQISLVAKEEISYLPGSLTSVAGSGTVPFGTVTNGTDWSYQLGGQTLVFKAKPSTDPLLGEYGLPQKSVLSQAPKVTQAAGAVLDASGAGSLLAYEFTPGPGGSGDVLASTGAGNQRFAINPAYKGGLAPLDPQYGQDGLKAGDQVYLSGSPGLPAGYYTLLPAHYALLPGGYAIEPLANSRDMNALDNRRNLDGSLVIAGRRVSGTDQRGDTRSAGFRLTPPDLIRRSSEFHLYDADSFFKTQAARDGSVVPGLPADGGQLTFSVQNGLALAGRTVLAGAAGGGRRGIVDIAAPDILVGSARGGAGGGGGGSVGGLTLSAPELVALGADSLLLGGRRTFADDGARLQVVAESVRVDNDAAHALTGPEILLAARDSVQLTGRASVLVQGAPEQLGRALTIDGQGLQADGALLRVSGGASTPVLRSAPAGVRGRLDIQAGAQVGGGASQYLDSTASMSLDGGLNVATGASLVLRAPQINLGAAAPKSSTGITLGLDGLSQWSRLAELDLLSYGGIDVWGPVAFGGAEMRHMALGAQALRGHGASLVLQAQNLSLTGTGPVDGVGPVRQAADQGSLSIKADTVQLGQGVLRVQGFATTDLQARGDLQVTGQATRLLVDND
ncbi:MAG: filamentous hemagglutinin N-terminal domain-containing protein, partial [Betaproteobacteria bacterium]